MAPKTTMHVPEKIAYVHELLKQHPDLTLTQIDKHIRARFSGPLNKAMMLDAFTAAGGRGDVAAPRRGPGRPRKNPMASPAAPKAARGGRSRENTAAKAAFVKELVDGNPGITMNEVSKRVKAKFGTQMAFPRLRQAFRDAGGKIGRPGRRPKPRTEQINRRVGRRASDYSAVKTRETLRGMPQHVVIVHTGGDIEPHEFGSRDDAERFTRNQLENGRSAADIAYYERQPLSVKNVSVNI